MIWPKTLLFRTQQVYEPTDILRLGICVKYFLLFPQKNLSPEKNCLLLNFWIIKFTVVAKKNHLTLGNLAKLVFWSISSFKNWKVFSGDRFFWGNKRKYFTQITGLTNLSKSGGTMAPPAVLRLQQPCNVKLKWVVWQSDI